MQVSRRGSCNDSCGKEGAGVQEAKFIKLGVWVTHVKGGQKKKKSHSKSLIFNEI